MCKLQSVVNLDFDFSLDDWPVSKFIGDCIFKKIIVSLWYHDMYSWEWFACPIIGCPCKTIDWRCCQYLIHFACFFAQFVSVRPRMSILWSLSMFLGGSVMSYRRRNWSLTLSSCCYSTIKKQIRGCRLSIWRSLRKLSTPKHPKSGDMVPQELK